MKKVQRQHVPTTSEFAAYEDLATLHLRFDQVDTLRLLLTSALRDFGSYKANWLPILIGTKQIKDLLENLNDATG